MTKLAIAAALVLGLVACDKKKEGTTREKAKAPPAATVAADGTRSVPVYVRKAGYEPDKITAKPGEKLELVFTRVEETECGAQVKVADGAVVDLPMNQPVPIKVTVPASGKVGFACGMDMMTGVVVVDENAKI